MMRLLQRITAGTAAPMMSVVCACDEVAPTKDGFGPHHHDGQVPVDRSELRSVARLDATALANLHLAEKQWIALRSGVIRPPFREMWIEWQDAETGVQWGSLLGGPEDLTGQPDPPPFMTTLVTSYMPSISPWPLLWPVEFVTNMDAHGMFASGSWHEPSWAKGNSRIVVSQQISELADDQCVTITTAALSMCNLRNAQTIVPPTSRPRPRRDRKREPRLDFHTLRIPSLGGSHGAPTGRHADLPQHVVRGHYKTFTPEQPLLGKFTGTYWWEPHLRGSMEHGLVISDYNVDPNA